MYCEESMLVYLSLINDADDKLKFEKLYLETRDFLLKIAFGMTSNEVDAEDVVYNSYYKLAESFDKYSNKSNDELKALLVTIVKHEAIDLFRKQGKVSEFDMETMVFYNQDCDLMPEESLLKNETNSQIRILLQELPEVLYEVLDLKYYQNMSNKEIADILGIKVKTVEIRLYRGKQKLKEILNDV